MKITHPVLFGFAIAFISLAIISMPFHLNSYWLFLDFFNIVAWGFLFAKSISHD